MKQLLRTIFIIPSWLGAFKRNGGAEKNENEIKLTVQSCELYSYNARSTIATVINR